MNPKDWNFQFQGSNQNSLQLPAISREELLKDSLRRICGFLPTQHDRFNACLINKTWSAAAIDVLWQRPELLTPVAFQNFLNTLRGSRTAPLRVKYLNITIPDNPWPNEFAPILASQRSEHIRMENTALDQPPLIPRLVTLCQRLESLTAYGWNLRDENIQVLANNCKGLVDLCIIGGKATNLTPALIQSLHKLMPKMRMLHLDGIASLSNGFLESVSRCQNLRSLKLSFAQVTHPNGLLSLASCAGTLTELVLANCDQLKPDNAEGFARTFRNLRTLVISGTFLNATILATLLSNCSSLLVLDLRSTLLGDGQPPPDGDLFPIPSSRAPSLQILRLDYIPFSDHLTHYLVPVLHNLHTLAISSSPTITDEAFRVLCTAPLATVHLLHCPGVSCEALRILAENTASFTLVDVVFDSCGLFTPSYVFRFTQACSRLRRVAVHGSRELCESRLYELATERNATDEAVGQEEYEAPAFKCTIEGDAIRQLTVQEQSVTELEQSVTLTMTQMRILAVRLDVPYPAIKAAVNDVLSSSSSRRPSSAQQPRSASASLSQTVSAQPSVANAVNSQVSTTPIATRSPPVANATGRQPPRPISVQDEPLMPGRPLPVSPHSGKSTLAATPQSPLANAPDNLPTMARPAAADQNERFHRQRQQLPQTELTRSTAAPVKNTGPWGAISVADWNPTDTVKSWDEAKKKKGVDRLFDMNQETEGWGGAPHMRISWSDEGKQGMDITQMEVQKQTVFWKQESEGWKKLAVTANLDSTDTTNSPTASSQHMTKTKLTASGRGSASSMDEVAGADGSRASRSHAPRGADRRAPGSGSSSSSSHGTGYGTGRGTGPGTDPGTGPGTGFGSGSGAGFGNGSGAGFGSGSGNGSGSGSGAGSGAGSGTRSGTRSGTSYGTNFGTGSGAHTASSADESRPPHTTRGRRASPRPIVDQSNMVIAMSDSSGSETSLTGGESATEETSEGMADVEEPGGGKGKGKAKADNVRSLDEQVEEEVTETRSLIEPPSHPGDPPWKTIENWRSTSYIDPYGEEQEEEIEIVNDGWERPGIGSQRFEKIDKIMPDPIKPTYNTFNEWANMAQKQLAKTIKPVTPKGSLQDFESNTTNPQSTIINKSENHGILNLMDDLDPKAMLELEKEQQRQRQYINDAEEGVDEDYDEDWTTPQPIGARNAQHQKQLKQSSHARNGVKPRTVTNNGGTRKPIRPEHRAGKWGGQLLDNAAVAVSPQVELLAASRISTPPAGSHAPVGRSSLLSEPSSCIPMSLLDSQDELNDPYNADIDRPAIDKIVEPLQPQRMTLVGTGTSASMLASALASVSATASAATTVVVAAAQEVTSSPPPLAPIDLLSEPSPSPSVLIDMDQLSSVVENGGGNGVNGKDPAMTDTVSDMGKILLELRLTTRDCGVQALVVRERDDPAALARQFCDRWAMKDMYEAIYQHVQTAITKKMEQREKKARKRAAAAAMNGIGNSTATMVESLI